MSAPKLTQYQFVVFGGNPDAPTVFEVLAFGRDITRTESAFAERRWGATTDRPLTSAAMIAYYALYRTGQFTGKWEDFDVWYLSVEPGEEFSVNPTDAGHAPA
jgi:hypothetical protein